MKFRPFLVVGRRFYSVKTGTENIRSQTTFVGEKEFIVDDYTNVTPKILSYIDRNLHNKQNHPLYLIKRRIVDHFYSNFTGRTGTPLFSVYDNINPVVSVAQNFDSLLIPEDHVSRRKSDCYYLNRDYLLRGHTTCHQAELIKMGLDNFLIFGDVYRRDEIDSTHFPVFHQADAVRLFTNHQLSDYAKSRIEIFEKDSAETSDKQCIHTLDASRIVEHQLKATLLSLAHAIFGQDVESRWVDVYFPFTHPSWELEVKHNGTWLEILGCGVIKHEILLHAGAGSRIGWAFGLGLERLAMRLYSIPDIRLFWSQDSGFTSQFQTDDPQANITYKPISNYPQCTNDVSFWLPTDRTFEPNDFYEIARETGGEIVEQIRLKDEFVHPKTGRASKCYSIVYRHLERTLKQEEVNEVHRKICDRITNSLGVTIR